MSGSFDAHEHVVRFYDRDDDLCRVVADFVAEGLRRREHVIVLASRDHWTAARSLLSPMVDVERAVATREILFCDTEDVIREITVDGSIDPERFRRVMAGALDRVRAPYRVFGELVSVLARRGLVDAAIEIEELGRELAQGADAQVLWAYDLRELKSDGLLDRVGSAPERAASPAPAPTGPLILLADDFEDARELYSDYLQLRGYRIVTAADGVEAVEQAHACQPALILLDIRMPRMTGIEAMLALRAEQQFTRVPIVALTAHAFNAERELFLSKGFDAVVAKPCLPDDLVQTVEALLARPSTV